MKIYQNRQHVIREARRARDEANSRLQLDDMAYVLFSTLCPRCKWDCTFVEPNQSPVRATCFNCRYEFKAEKLRFEVYTMSHRNYDAVQKARFALHGGLPRSDTYARRKDTNGDGTPGSGGRTDSDDAGQAGIHSTEGSTA